MYTHLTFSRTHLLSRLKTLLRLHYSVLAAVLSLTACSVRPPVPPGVIPAQTELTTEDEQYGHEVMNSLVDQFPLDTDDDRINRVRDIVDRLTAAGRVDTYPWHVHILVGPDIKNAAATRGNYVFVWTGMLNTVQNDDELATILAHEIGHVLAGHTAPNPAEEASRIIAGVVGMAAGQVVAHQGVVGIGAQITEDLIRSTLEAVLVNPGSQSNEIEADHIGFFLMSDARYDPEQAVAFWQRVQSDPDFQNASLQFFSTHPSTEERVFQLRQLLPDAQARYQAALRGEPPPVQSISVAPSALPPSNNADTNDDKSILDTYREAKRQRPAVSSSFSNPSLWSVEDSGAAIHTSPSSSSAITQELSIGDQVIVEGRNGRWLRVTQPAEGYVLGRYLSPL